MLRRVIKRVAKQTIKGVLAPFGMRPYRHDIGDYMSRWILIHPGGTVRLHNIRREDADNDLHDHPWDFVSIILRGGYIEEVPKNPLDRAGQGGTEFITYTPGCVNVVSAEDSHRIDLVMDNRLDPLEPGETGVWTLVFAGNYKRGWGFWSRYSGKFIPWRVYTNSKPGVDVSEYEARLKEVGVVE